MSTIEDLFDKRSVVGIKIEQIILERGYTKIDLCKNSGVSRPTLDKLLAGTLTNKTNYEKHIYKVLDCLSITPDVLLGNIRNEYNRTREIKNVMRISSEDIAKVTSISLSRLKEIEAGERATLAELRDIAMCLSVSVSCLLGKNFFEPQISHMDLFIKSDQTIEVENFSGFWGYIGISLCNTDKSYWFPITSSVRKMVYNMMSNERIIVPCMNNKVLILNMQYVKEIVLLDEACDQPDFLEWDYHVDCGEMPLVIYEALEDYVLYDIDSEEVVSRELQKHLQELLKDKGWSEDDVCEKIDLSYIHYSDGNIRPVIINFEQEESISEEVKEIYLYEDSGYAENVLYCEDAGGAEIILNMKNIAMIELPLLKVENKICKEWEELYE